MTLNRYFLYTSEIEESGGYGNAEKGEILIFTEGVDTETQKDIELNGLAEFEMNKFHQESYHKDDLIELTAEQTKLFLKKREEYGQSGEPYDDFIEEILNQ